MFSIKIYFLCIFKIILSPLNSAWDIVSIKASDYFASKNNMDVIFFTVKKSGHILSAYGRLKVSASGNIGSINPKYAPIVDYVVTEARSLSSPFPSVGSFWIGNTGVVNLYNTNQGTVEYYVSYSYEIDDNFL